MTSACAGIAITGSAGETITFTRASANGTCSKGNPFSNIANGDLVKLTTDQPRVMPGGDGTGAVGVLMEPARNNYADYSEAFDNAAWLKLGLVAAAPTVTADAAVAPDGTTTAERIQFEATTIAGGGYSIVYNNQGCKIPNPTSSSVYLKGNGGSGTIDLCLVVGAATYTCTAASYSASIWKRVTLPNVSQDGSDGSFFFGNASGLGGLADRAASDVYAWGAQCENGADVTSYVPTTSATDTTRAADVMSAAVTVPSTGIQSFSLDWLPSAGLLANSTGLKLKFGGVIDDQKIYLASSKGRCDFRIAGVSSTVDTPGALTANALNHVACYYDGTVEAACLGTCTTASASLALDTGAATIYLGTRDSTGNEADGVIKNVCLAKTATDCL